jgi:hypothetical protein
MVKLLGHELTCVLLNDEFKDKAVDCTYTDNLHLFEAPPADQAAINNIVQKFTSLIELHIGLALMKMPVLERKIFGSQIITKNTVSCFADPKNLKLNWLDKDRILEWLDNVNIFQEFFGVDVHIELMK